MLLDSNIIIYFSKDTLFEDFSSKHTGTLFVSKITKLEVLGYHNLSVADKKELTRIFNLLSLIDIDNSIIEEAIKLRQKKNISLGDSIIASTALIHNLPLVTANTADFKWIKKLQLISFSP